MALAQLERALIRWQQLQAQLQPVGPQPLLLLQAQPQAPQQPGGPQHKTKQHAQQSGQQHAQQYPASGDPSCLQATDASSTSTTGSATSLAATLLEAEGLALYHLNRVYCEAVLLYRTSDRTSRYSEWPQLQSDLVELASVVGADRKLAVLDRVMRTYKVFQR